MYVGGALNKKAMILLEQFMLWIIILVVVFLTSLSFYMLNHEGIVPVGEIIQDPSSWVGKTVTVEGILESVPMPSPTNYILCTENQTGSIGVQWNSSDSFIPQYNAIVYGTINEEEWTPPNLVPSHTMEVYYIEAENLELL